MATNQTQRVHQDEDADKKTQEPVAPQHPPRYSRIRKLGRGSFGVVWLCSDNKNGVEVVAKELYVRNDSERTNALTEASLLSRIRHFNVIGYLDVHKAGSEHVFIYMEYANDGDVESKILVRQHKSLFFQSSIVMQWLVQLSQAIEYLHYSGYIHRDIKVANLFLNKLGFLKLGDFGIAKCLRSNAPTMSARTTRTPVGTPMYISPQICAGEPYNQKSDLWGLGCCLYEICSLKPAFIGRSMDQLVARIKKGQHGNEIPFHYSQEIHELIDDLLTVNANERPSMKSVLARPLFATWLEHSPATLISLGHEPKPYHNAVPIDPHAMRTRLAQASAPDILKVYHPRTSIISDGGNRSEGGNSTSGTGGGGARSMHRHRYEIKSVAEEKPIPRPATGSGFGSGLKSKEKSILKSPPQKLKHPQTSSLMFKREREGGREREREHKQRPQTQMHPRRSSTPDDALTTTTTTLGSPPARSTSLGMPDDVISRLLDRPRKIPLGGESKLKHKRASLYQHRRANSDGTKIILDQTESDPVPHEVDGGFRKLAALDLRGSPHMSKKLLKVKSPKSKLCASVSFHDREINNINTTDNDNTTTTTNTNIAKSPLPTAKSLSQLSKYYKGVKDRGASPGIL